MPPRSFCDSGFSVCSAGRQRCCGRSRSGCKPRSKPRRQSLIARTEHCNLRTSTNCGAPSEVPPMPMATTMKRTGTSWPAPLRAMSVPTLIVTLPPCQGVAGTRARHRCIVLPLRCALCLQALRFTCALQRRWGQYIVAQCTLVVVADGAYSFVEGSRTL